MEEGVVIIFFRIGIIRDLSGFYLYFIFVVIRRREKVLKRYQMSIHQLEKKKSI